MGAAATASSNSDNSNMLSCDKCSVKLHVFKTKVKCYECDRIHCVDCIAKLNQNVQRSSSKTVRICSKCHLLVSGNFNRHDLDSYRARDLQHFLVRRKIATDKCCQKEDLIDLVLSFSKILDRQYEDEANHVRHVQELRERRVLSDENLRLTAQIGSNSAAEAHSSGTFSVPTIRRNEEFANSVTSSSISGAASESNTPLHSTSSNLESTIVDSAANIAPNASPSETAATINPLNVQKTPEITEKRRIRIEDIKSEAAIDDLSIRQLKEILTNSYVDYKGCCERNELVTRAKLLLKDYHLNLDRAAKIEAEEEQVSSNQQSTDMCKVCMDAVIDCVLLDCGHMVTCTQCGKKMAECPICRQYVVRVVHVFRV